MLGFPNRAKRIIGGLCDENNDCRERENRFGPRFCVVEIRVIC